jgi:hypothetical protein
MKSKQLIIIVLLVAVIIGFGYFTFRSKQQSQTQPPVVSGTEQQNTGWQEETVSEIGLTLKHPQDLVFRKEVADDNGRIRTVGFFLTKGSEDNPEYQMYGLYQQFKDGTQQDLELAKKEMDTTTIKEASIAGYEGIEGLIVGPKMRFITTVIKDSKLFSVSTIPPTEENKALSTQIMESFSFR